MASIDCILLSGVLSLSALSLVPPCISTQGLFDIAAQRYKDYQERARRSELQELLASANMATRPSSDWQPSPMRVDPASADSALGMDIPARRMPLVQPSRAVAARAAVGVRDPAALKRATRSGAPGRQARQAVADAASVDDSKPQMMPNMRNEIDAW